MVVYFRKSQVFGAVYGILLALSARARIFRAVAVGLVARLGPRAERSFGETIEAASYVSESITQPGRCFSCFLCEKKRDLSQAGDAVEQNRELFPNKLPLSLFSLC